MVEIIVALKMPMVTMTSSRNRISIMCIIAMLQVLILMVKYEYQ